MTAQADQFLIHADFVGIDGDFLYDPAIIQSRLFQQLPDLVLQPAAVIGHDHGRAFGNKFHIGCHFIQFGGQVLIEEFAFPDPGMDKVLRRLCQGFLQGLPDQFHIGRFLLQFKNVRKAGQVGDPDVIFDPQLLGHLLQIAQVLRGDPAVVFNRNIGLGQVFQRDKNIHLAALDILLQHLADPGLQLAQLSGHLNADVQITVVDGFHFHRDPVILITDLGPAVTGHTLDHQTAPFQCQKGIVIP